MSIQNIRVLTLLVLIVSLSLHGYYEKPIVEYHRSDNKTNLSIHIIL